MYNGTRADIIILDDIILDDVPKRSNKTLKRRQQRKRKKMIGTTANTFVGMMPTVNNVSSAWAEVYGIAKTTEPAQKKGKPMCYDCDYNEQPTVENRRLTHAQNRVSSIFYQKNGELRKMFHMDPDDRPTTGKELVERITAGKYSLKNEEDLKNNFVWSILDYITWRDPAVKMDEEGYKTAKAELEASYNVASDAATLGDAAAALAAINTFLSWKPTNAPAA